VERGALLGRMSDRDHRTAPRKLRAEIEENEAGLKLLRDGPRAEEIAVARTALEKAP
jgi:hypothetical protein